MKLLNILNIFLMYVVQLKSTRYKAHLFFFFHSSNPSDKQIEGEQHLQHQFSQSIYHNRFEMSEKKKKKKNRIKLILMIIL